MTDQSVAFARRAAFVLTLLATVLSGCGSGNTPIPLSPDQIDHAQRAFAERVASQTLRAWDAGEFAPLGEDFVPNMREGMPSDVQRGTHEGLFERFGALQSLSFVEAYALRGAQEATVYRFKGTFSTSDEHPEVRVVVDAASGKVRGFWVKPWLDALS
jgi:hypothetical protein